MMSMMWLRQCHQPAMTGNGPVAPRTMVAGGWYMKLFEPHESIWTSWENRNTGKQRYFSIEYGDFHVNVFEESIEGIWS